MPTPAVHLYRCLPSPLLAADGAPGAVRHSGDRRAAVWGEVGDKRENHQTVRASWAVADQVRGAAGAGRCTSLHQCGECGPGLAAAGSAAQAEGVTDQPADKVSHVLVIPGRPHRHYTPPHQQPTLLRHTTNRPIFTSSAEIRQNWRKSINSTRLMQLICQFAGLVSLVSNAQGAEKDKLLTQSFLKICF